MNAPDPATAVHNGPNPCTAQRVENGLSAMRDVMADDHIPLAVRHQVALAHQMLHACRDELTVRRMEREKGLR